MRKRPVTLAVKITKFFATYHEALTVAEIIVKLDAGQAVELTYVTKSGFITRPKAVAVGTLSTLEKGYVRIVEQVSEGQTQWRSITLGRLLLKS